MWKKAGESVSLTRSMIHWAAVFILTQTDLCTVYMLHSDIQFQNSTPLVGEVTLARFDVQDVIVSDMEMFDDQELGMILVDPTGMSE